MALFNFQDSNSVVIKEYIKQNLPFLAIEYDGRRASIRRNPNYQETVNSVKKAFSALQQTPNTSITLCAPLLEFNDILQITEELWSDMLPRLMLVKIVLDQASRQEAPPVGMQIHTKTQMGKLTTFNVTPQTTIGEVKAMIHEKEGVLVEDQRLGFNDQELLYDHWTLATCGIYHGATLNLACALRFGKPVIYLYPPAPLADIQVQLSLVRAWEFSALYPPVAISKIPSGALGQTIWWQVDAKPNGLLFDRSTRREVTYLFWEAHSHAAPKSLPSPVSSRPATPTDSDPEPTPLFDPAHPVVNPDNSVLLPFDKVTGYVDDVLLALGLHTEARTSFITYWLPDLQKHSLVALRFLPQAEYEAAAPLDITPAPEVITRVFMLFRGVDQNEAEVWKNAIDRAGVDVRNWRQVVGVDVEKAADNSLFRVLEWGGVEVV